MLSVQSCSTPPRSPSSSSDCPPIFLLPFPGMNSFQWARILPQIRNTKPWMLDIKVVKMFSNTHVAKIHSESLLLFYILSLCQVLCLPPLPPLLLCFPSWPVAGTVLGEEEGKGRGAEWKVHLLLPSIWRLLFWKE